MHGSLARAGKVRGQTPKVPKQEKKKQPKVRLKGENAEALPPPRPPGCRRLGQAGLRFETPGAPPPPRLQGRAMKRLKYNRRFVNVVVGFGKKRGAGSGLAC